MKKSDEPFSQNRYGFEGNFFVGILLYLKDKKEASKIIALGQEVF